MGIFLHRRTFLRAAGVSLALPLSETKNPVIGREIAQPPKRMLQICGPIEHEVRSDYSHIRIRKKGSVRTMLFVRDNGLEVGETQVDLRRPHALRMPYTRALFASYLIRPVQKRVLLVGLGGGAMVHFLKRHHPDLVIDAVEIDPAVVKIANDFFGVRSEDKVNVITADGFDYFGKTKHRYDAIYMDAFLKPAADTDETGVSLRMKTVEFYKDVAAKLRPGGAVAFNLNPHRGLRDDIRTIQTTFTQTYVFRVAGSVNLVAIAANVDKRIDARTLRTRAGNLDRRFRANFSFRRFPPLLVR